MGPVIYETRCERTERLLEGRLEAVARVAAQLRHAEAERLVELASVATMRAVALEILLRREGRRIWRDAHARHPELPHVHVELPRRLAA